MNIIAAEPSWWVLVTRDDDPNFSMLLQVVLWMQEGQKAVPMVACGEEVVRVEVVVDKLKRAALAKSEEIKVMYQIKYIAHSDLTQREKTIAGARDTSLF